MKAKLRVCASCEWIFKGAIDCPKCGFGSYGARYVYGDKAYDYVKTQIPWIEKKVANYYTELWREVEETNENNIKSKSRLSSLWP
jgi:hypothetical protein